MSKMIKVKGQEISEDTIVAALRKHIRFEERKEFKKIEFCHLRVDVTPEIIVPNKIVLSWKEGGGVNCWETPDGIRRIIKGLQSAIVYAEEAEENK
ncbi:hypothetical protein LCGC14_0400610 [marine sediment metagenome]|uniref:Uncharacterized protein n=1 Tax=marine sediment metagenome TaxID=412755 RepID=A0A0F9VIY3_9ZZZZ